MCEQSRKPSTTKIGEYILYGYSMSTIWASDNIENKHTLYRRENFMKKFCNFLREHATNILNFEKKEILPLTKEKLKLHQNEISCYICRRRILQKFAKNKNYRKIRDHCNYTGKYRGAARSICNLKFTVPNEIDVVFHDGLNYDHYFIIKDLVNEF